jgi:hypothetical protein
MCPLAVSGLSVDQGGRRLRAQSPSALLRTTGITVGNVPPPQRRNLNARSS